MNTEVNPYAATQVDLEQSVGDELELAGRGTRLAAVILDGLIGGALVIPAVIVFAISAAAGGGSQLAASAGSIAAFSFTGIALLALTVYNFVLIHRGGQTIGKKILKIRIVRTDGSRCGIRRFVFIRHLPVALLGAIPFIGAIISLLDPLLIFRQSRRCLHDEIAGTIVIKA
ncbi:RDD family protein [Andreprevotia chitinilytica]|uniref:RDD family protein n=1 Tax=Andreprevotia chitinilytica TaxID=396808 RepID=UPI00054D5319|nr:RDD family protein [Andreprevotia chitinilytica]